MTFLIQMKYQQYASVQMGLVQTNPRRPGSIDALLVSILLAFSVAFLALCFVVVMLIA